MVINLKELINEHPDCLSSGERLKAYLLDLYPNEFGRINILVSLFEYGITKKIEKGFEHNIDEINDYINKFIIDYGFQRKIAEECANIWIDAQTENLFENIDIINEKLDNYMNSTAIDYQFEDGDSFRSIFWFDLVTHIILIEKSEGDKLTDDEIDIVKAFVGNENIPNDEIRKFISGLDDVKSSASVQIPRIIEIVKNVDDKDLHKRIKEAFVETYNLVINTHGKEELSSALYMIALIDLIKKSLKIK